MSAPQERRRLQRADRGDVPFLFLQDQMEPLEAVAQDASIRSARFPLAVRSRLEPYVAGGGEITFGQATARFEHLAIPPELIREDQGTFVVTFRMRQFSVGDTAEGRLASYRILKFAGGGQFSETYEAEVIRVSSATARLRAGDAVVIELPLCLPYLSNADINGLTARLEALLGREDANLTRVADLGGVAGILDVGLHQFPREGTTPTCFLVQRRLRGEELDEYVIRNHANAEAGAFTGLPADEFHRLAASLARTLQQVHARLVVHGDLWPEHIVMSPADEPVLIGLGQAVFREAANPLVKVSGRHRRYLAPEGVRSRGADLYSLGGVLHYLATGEDPPASTPDAERLSTAVRDRIRARNPELHQRAPGVADVIARCLSRSDRRYPDVLTLLDHLELCLRTVSDRNDKEDADVRAALDELVREGKPLDAKASGQLRRLAVVRAHRLRDELRDLGRGVHDVAGDPDTLAASLTRSLAFLGARDEYLTISTPRFWRPGNPGRNGEFRSMTLTAAARGAAIRHLLIVPSSEWGSDRLDDVMTSHLETRRELQAFAPDATLEVKVLFVPLAGRGDLVAHDPDEVGLLVRKDEIVAVFPEYREDGSLTAVRYRATLDLVAGRKDVFRSFWNHPDTLMLRAWPSTLQIQERAYALYARRGHEDGGDLEDFVRARRELIELIEAGSAAPIAV